MRRTDDRSIEPRASPQLLVLLSPCMRPITGPSSLDTTTMMSHHPSSLDEAFSHDTDPKGKHRAKQSCVPCRTRKVKVR